MIDGELFELCKEVYKRTQWGDVNALVNHKLWHPEYSIPIYTSDYLLEKLSALMPTLMLRQKETLVDVWAGGEMLGFGKSDTPLKALLKLVIALDNAGVKI